MKPPKCKTCGAEEWRHICGPAISERVAVELKMPCPQPPPLFSIQPEGVMTVQVPEKRGRGRPKTTTPEQRKTYLAKKAKERRAKGKTNG